ncbi:MAG: nitrilase-related carbon-nitrogen hydrolase [Bacteroidales bacterium]
MFPLKHISSYLALAAGLLFYTAAGLNWNIGAAAWIAPVFLLYFTRNIRWGGFLLFYLGMALSASLSKTAENLSGIFVIYISTGLSHGIINSLPYVIDRLLMKRGDKFYSTLIFPSAVIFVEYLLSLILGIWGNSSVAQFPHFNLIQSTSVFGIFSISFLVTWMASLINWIIFNGFEKRILSTGLGIYGFVYAVAMIYGSIRINLFPPRSETVKVAAIVSDTDIHKVFDEWVEDIPELMAGDGPVIPVEVFSGPEVIASQIGKTNEALQQGAKIVVWNEMALIVSQQQRDSVLHQIRLLCRQYHAYVLLAFLEENPYAMPKPFNNISIFLQPDGGIVWEYMKAFLTPPEKLIINRGDAKIPFIDTEYGRIGNAICSDVDVTGYMAQTGKNRMDILLVPAFDWKEITTYHSNLAAFTAIQFGVSLVRANGKGMVAFYDYQGNVLGMTDTFCSNSKINYAEVPVQSTTTFYSIIGNIFVYLAAMFLFIILGMQLSGKVKHLLKTK